MFAKVIVIGILLMIAGSLLSAAGISLQGPRPRHPRGYCADGARGAVDQPVRPAHGRLLFRDHPTCPGIR
ncbi:MAG: hypothetical protein MZV65_20555 [Chromatiales bacterium]|nr:hypothetical protein [Chromatiales bacterium]